MARNIIVTCGTSQIEGEKLDIISKYAERGFCDRAKNIRKAGKEGITDGCFGDFIDETTKDGSYCKEMADILAAKWDAIDEYIGEEGNPFGAEICTLYKMTQEKPSAFEPGMDQIAILYSDTEPGAFCAAILYNLLTHNNAFRMSLERIKHKRISKLREVPVDVSEAEKNVREALFRARNDEVPNAFVMTGGFKSIIPMLTICAIVNDDPIYYLFERSDELRCLILRNQVEVLEEGRWRSFWTRHSSKGSKKVVIIEVETGTGTPPPPKPLHP